MPHRRGTEHLFVGGPRTGEVARRTGLPMPHDIGNAEMEKPPKERIGYYMRSVSTTAGGHMWAYVHLSEWEVLDAAYHWEVIYHDALDRAEKSRGEPFE